MAEDLAYQDKAKGEGVALKPTVDVWVQESIVLKSTGPPGILPLPLLQTSRNLFNVSKVLSPCL